MLIKITKYTYLQNRKNALKPTIPQYLRNMPHRYSTKVPYVHDTIYMAVRIH